MLVAKTLCGAAAALLPLADPAGAAEGPSENRPRIEKLWPDGAPGALGNDEKDQPKLFIYLPGNAGTSRTAIIVCPGGGYRNLAMGHEGHDVARWLNSIGAAAFVCDYRHRGKGYGHPAPLDDAQRAIRTVRSRAEEFGVAADQVGILGFSAGGHLASTAATHFDAGDPQADDPIGRAGSRPDFAILCYPVISLVEPFAHGGSRKNLLGDNADETLRRSLSNETQVTAETPPTFLWHTGEDTGVLPDNSIVFYQSLRKAGVPAELHIYERGRHGRGLAQSVPGTADWPARCEAWLRGHGWLAKTAP